MLSNFIISFNWKHYVVLVLALVIFSTGLKNQFNNWDDSVYVTENPFIQLNGKNIKQSFFKGETHGMYLPVTALSLSMNYNFSQLNSTPYLLTNLIIHLLNIILVFALVHKWFNNHTLTLFVGALFALHPLQAESVCYVAGRRDILYALFYFLSIISYINYLSIKDKKWMRWCYVFFVLSFLSKGQAIALPATLILVDFIKQPDFNFRKSVTDKLYLILLSVIFIVITMIVKQKSIGFNLTGEILTIPFYMKFLFAFYAYIMYIVNALVPYHLSLIHPYPETLTVSASIILSLLVVVGLLIFVIKKIKKHKEICVGLLFFSVNIFLVLQLIPNSYGLMNDHYMYVPIIGIFISVYFLFQKIAKAETQMMIIVYCFIGLSSVLVFNRIKVFKNNTTVFTDMIKKYPESVVAYNNRGTDYFNQGKMNEAFNDFNKALAIDDKLASSFNNRATVLLARQQYKEALLDLDKAIELDANYANAYSNKGIALAVLGGKNALDFFNKAISLNKNDGKLYYNRAGYWLQYNRKDLACEDVRTAHLLGAKQANPALENLCR